MSQMSVDGLVSGLSTTQLIQQLMQVERGPQQRLQTRQSDDQNVLSAYQTLSTKLSAISTAALTLDSASDWQTMKVTTSSSSVSASAAPGASAAALAFTVTSLAAAHTLASSGSVADTSTTSVITPGQTVTVNGQAITVEGTGTLTDLVNAINSNSSTGVTAAAIQVAPNQFRLQLSAKSSGAAGVFTADLTNATGIGGGTTLVATGKDASIHVGDDNAAGYDVTSTTNTFSGVLTGVTFTVSQTTDVPVSLNVVPDADALAGKVQAMVTAANDALGYINSQSAYDSSKNKAGLLLADPLVNTLQQSIVEAVSNAIGGSTFGTAGKAGITLNQDGTFAFDKTVFTASYASDPDHLTALFYNGTTIAPGDGIAERLRAMTKAATDAASGSLTLAIQSKQSEIRGLGDEISDWDTRLSDREAALRQQFSAMEIALGKMRDQSNWLSGQIASLPQSG